MPRRKRGPSPPRFGLALPLLLLVILGLGIAVPVIGVMRAKQRKSLIAINLKNCRPSRAQKALPFGSVTVNVLGKNKQGCALTIRDEVEMGETLYQCTYPLRTGKLIIWSNADRDSGSGISWADADRHCTRKP